MIRGACALVLAVVPLQGPVLRVQSGSARLAERESIRTLEPRAGAVGLAGEWSWVELPALAEAEVCWRGRASVDVTGPAAFEVGQGAALALASFRSVEVEVRRGAFDLSIAGAGSIALAPGLLRVRTLPGGVLVLENRGAAALTLAREGAPPVTLPPWTPVRVRSRADVVTRFAPQAPARRAAARER